MNTGNNKKSNGPMKVILSLLVGIIVLAAGAAGGYYWSTMDKDQQVEEAKTTAKTETLKVAAADLEKSKAAAKQKVSAETTCNADELTLSTAASSDSGAGTLAYDLVLTNVGKRTCTLGGFPGVSLVNDNGNQIGLPAERTANAVEKKLTLAPNAKVKAVVSVSNSSNFSDGQCKEGATKFRVYPPNDVGYLSVAATVDSWCPGFMISPVLEM